MVMLTIFHFALTLTTLIAGVAHARQPSLRGFAAGLAVVVLIATFLAHLLPAFFGAGGFGFMLLAAVSLFIYLPIYLLFAAAVLVRRQRWTAAIAGTGALTLVGVGIYAFFVEPTNLEVSHHEIRSPRLDREIRVVVLADFQTDQFGNWERRVLDTIMDQEPDLILLPGDYVQVHNEQRRSYVRAALRHYLQKIEFGAPLGAFAVRGDVETDDWPEIFAGTGVRALRFSGTLDLPGLTLTALTLHDSRYTDLKVPRAENFHIAFGHAPDFALKEVEADLLVAGHTHGGQVQIPGIGPLIWFSRVPRDWATGVTDVGRGRTLVVSRGTGMERHWAPRLRFFCRPEIVVLDLLPI